MAQLLHRDLKSILLARQSNHKLFWHWGGRGGILKLTRACKTHATDMPGLSGLNSGLSSRPLRPASEHRPSKKQHCFLTVSPYKLFLAKKSFFSFCFSWTLVTSQSLEESKSAFGKCGMNTRSPLKPTYVINTLLPTHNDRGDPQGEAELFETNHVVKKTKK